MAHCQRGAKIERIDFKGERLRVVPITVNRLERWQMPPRTRAEFFTTDGITGGGFRGIVTAIDDSTPGVRRVWLTRAARAAGG